MKPVDTAIFVAGVAESKAEEKIISDLMSKNIAVAHLEYPDDELVITETPVPKHY